MHKIHKKWHIKSGSQFSFLRSSGILWFLLPALFPAVQMNIHLIRSSESNKDSLKVLELLPSAYNPRNSEGDFITLRDGRILFIYTHYTGKSGDDNGSAFLAARYSDDNGKTWSSRDLKIVGQEGRMNVMSVSLLRLQSGEIALFYLRKNSTSDCIPVVRFSKDEAVTWSNPEECITDRRGYFVLNNSRVIQLTNSRILFAVAMHQTPGDSIFSERGRIWSYFSDDNGRSWIPGNEVSNPGNIITQEPGLVEIKNGAILMYVRTTSGVQYFSCSHDNGMNWSEFVPGNIESPCSPASIVRIPGSGNLMLVWNDNGKDQRRTPLNMAISEDDAKTWIKNTVLRDNPEGVYCYPAIHFVGDDVLISYSDWSTMGTTILRLKKPAEP
jgi:sialidase-1